MKIGVDLDGVCYDFTASLRHYLVTHRGRDEATMLSHNSWDFFEDWGLTLDEFLTEFAAGVDAGVVFTHGGPYPGTVEALGRLASAGHSIHIITDRTVGSPGRSEAATVAWLKRHGVPYKSLTFCSDKTVLRTDYMIEDKLQNYDALEAAGCTAVLIDQPWNQVDGDTRRRVANLHEFADLVLG